MEGSLCAVPPSIVVRIDVLRRFHILLSLTCYAGPPCAARLVLSYPGTRGYSTAWPGQGAVPRKLGKVTMLQSLSCV